jgi:ferric-dicitrate binding protein FerR (iron transport regulator)
MNETMNANQFSDLLQRYRLGTCTEEEKNLVEGWYNERRDTIYNPLTEEEEALVGEKIYEGITERLDPVINEKVIPIWRRNRVWWVAAGTVILMATAGYFLFNHKQSKTDLVRTPIPLIKPVTPGGNKALLTLANGSVIVLDSAANGALTQQGKSIVFKKQDGELVYKNEGNSKSETVALNTISTPRGGQYQVVLPDGSKVWLNAVSSLRFPASFTTNERVVELTGEAYFEIVKEAKRPFIVNILPSTGTAGASKVEVLGTHFNIMAYNDEATINTTLLEGSVNMTSTKGHCTLKPGEQAQVAKNGQLAVDKHADVE